jgi:hypothetical protein
MDSLLLPLHWLRFYCAVISVPHVLLRFVSERIGFVPFLGSRRRFASFPFRIAGIRRSDGGPRGFALGNSVPSRARRVLGISFRSEPVRIMAYSRDFFSSRARLVLDADSSRMRRTRSREVECGAHASSLRHLYELLLFWWELQNKIIYGRTHLSSTACWFPDGRIVPSRILV